MMKYLLEIFMEIWRKLMKTDMDGHWALGHLGNRSSLIYVDDLIHD